jgi:phosphoglucosamine mutase
MSKLFGTDGVRGEAGKYPLDAATITRLGAALVRALPRSGELKLLAGRDTRESGVWIEEALARGVASEGAHLTSAGVLPTPGVAYLTADRAFDAGLVISASHNPYQDNGIKVFSGRGEKFGETLERAIEGLVADQSWQPAAVGDPGLEPHDYSEGYLDKLRSILPDPSSWRGQRIAIDCANGATSVVAPRLFESLGVEALAIGIEPNGRNINLDCGSTHPGRLAQIVREGGFRLGVAFDGDGDRAIFVDHTGRVVDGDAVLLMCAKAFAQHGRLASRGVVATVMSNIGLELALKDADIELYRCPVGDKYVMEEMVRRGLTLGGEQSGHIIFADHLFTGDGLATALFVMRTMSESRQELADLANELVAYPQVLVNVRVPERRDLTTLPGVVVVMADVERRLAGQGRLLVRYSGTEPLLRIMLEGRDQGEIQEMAGEIASAVREGFLGS